jgi:predicted ferric reductase
MTFNSHGKKQLWIAGGVGITPFLSYLRSPKLPTTPITLIYAVRNQDEAVHLEIFKAYEKAHKNFTFILHESSKDGYLTHKTLPLHDHLYISMCGPRMMIKPLKKSIEKQYPLIDITSEAFSFTGNLVSDILDFIKKLIKPFLKKKHTH